MLTRRLTALGLIALLPAVALAQDTVRTSGRIATGALQINNSTNSSKLTEYRDLRDDVFLFDLGLNALHPRGLFLDLSGTNLSRRDQNARLTVGAAGSWRLDAEWNEIPHQLSNKAQSPYIVREPGRFVVPQTMAITFKKLATSSVDAPNVVASDEIISAYAQAFTRPIALANQTKTGAFTLRYPGLEPVDLSLSYTRRTKSGSKLSYGPIGDRPPRTLNIELAEPVDYRTGDLKLAAEYKRPLYQVRFEYLFSDFADEVGTLEWQNVFATPTAGASYDTWDRLIGAFGRRPLPPDNRYHNATVSGGADLPRDSRLTASLSFGRLDQEETLLPYAFQVDRLANATLPRASADARMNTMALNVEYAIAPLQRLHLRAFFRRFGLDNETPASQWQYVTSDATNVNGTVSFKNKRVSLPYAWDRQNLGLNASWRVEWWRSSVELGLEREDIDREFREANTGENILRASWRSRPLRTLSLRASYLRGDRAGGTYDWAVTRQSYWYAPAEAGTDQDNPGFLFSNHPDMRRDDVSDRQRDHMKLKLGWTPRATLSLSATLAYRREDFDSDVAPVQPLRETTLADREASTPGDQLGLLRSDRKQVSIDAFYAPTERISVNASIGWDAGKTKQRGLEFNENNKGNPSTVATAELGPWTRAGSQWTADTDDRTRYASVGAAFDLLRDVTLSANYTLSLGRLDLEYAGFGVTNFNGTTFPPNHQFAFSSPPAVRHDAHVGDLRVEFPIMRDVMVQLGYAYDQYRLRDWQQDDAAPWVEAVGTDLLLRDTSRSHQWGNRLFNMGTLKAPSYTAHSGYVSFAYQF